MEAVVTKKGATMNIELKKYGFFRAGVAVPTLEVGNPTYNISVIKKMLIEANKENVDILVFPELCLTGYTCADLFYQTALLESAMQALLEIKSASERIKTIFAVGLPIMKDNQIFNCAVILSGGKILGVVPKTYLPQYSEYYEARWFQSANNRTTNEIELFGQKVPFTPNVLFKHKHSGAVIGIEMCEDLWVPMPPSTMHVLHGANVIINLSASNELVGKADYRRQLISQQSARCYSAYLYASAGPSESTTDLVFSGHSVIAESGRILNEMIFPEDSQSLYADIDIEKIMNERRKTSSFMKHTDNEQYEIVEFNSYDANGIKTVNNLLRTVERYPLVPIGAEEVNSRCSEISKIQSIGLAQRMKKAKIEKAVIGLSGGLDSTLALLVIVKAIDMLKLPRQNIIAVTMPGFGTTGRTYQNAVNLMKEIGATCREISIVDACLQHFKDIGHDITVHDVTYENTQARERTQILMDIANKEGGLVVGTGDLSELALGWCTYNGDHMSMYSVNSSIPKTLVKFLVKWYMEHVFSGKISEILFDIIETPISPELLPPNKEGTIAQKTEEIVGSYVLHDFFLYHMLRNNYSPSKIYMLAKIAMANTIEDTAILGTLRLFYKRFFSQQWKRSCLPDGVKVGSLCLSPREFRMPSDADSSIWINELNNL